MKSLAYDVIASRLLINGTFLHNKNITGVSRITGTKYKSLAGRTEFTVAVSFGHCVLRVTVTVKGELKANP